MPGQVCWSTAGVRGQHAHDPILETQTYTRTRTHVRAHTHTQASTPDDCLQLNNLAMLKVKGTGSIQMAHLAQAHRKSPEKHAGESVLCAHVGSVRNANVDTG